MDYKKKIFSLLALRIIFSALILLVFVAYGQVSAEQAEDKADTPVEEQIIYVNDSLIKSKEQIDDAGRFINLGRRYPGVVCLDAESIEIVTDNENECELTATVYQWEWSGTAKPYEPREIRYRYNLQEETIELWQDDEWQLIERVSRGRVYNALLTGEILYYKAFGEILKAGENNDYVQYLLRNDIYYYFDIKSVSCVEESADRVVLTAEAYYKLPSEDYLYPNGELEFAYDLSEGCVFSLRNGRDIEVGRRGGYLNSIADLMYKQYFGEQFPYQEEK